MILAFSFWRRAHDVVRIARQRCRYFVSLDQRDYEDILAYRTPTDAAYVGTPLFALNPKVRSQLLEKVARRHYGQAHTVIDPPRTWSHDGRYKLAPCHSSCDFLADDRRVEVKSSQLQFNKFNRVWHFQFQKIKPLDFDIALLMLYSPRGVSIVEWDWSRYSTRGKYTETSGGRVVIAGPRSCTSYSSALDSIMERDRLPGTLLTHVLFDDPFYSDLLAQAQRVRDPYDGVPLADLSNSLRGCMLQRVSQRVDEQLFGVTSPPRQERSYNGDRLLSSSQASYDWLQADGRRVEAKSSKFRIEQGCWRFRFQNINTDKFDDLRLLLYSPRGVHIVSWDGSRWSRAGKETDTAGEQISISGQHGACFNDSLGHVLSAKIPGWVLAFMPWTL